ncbi:MAG: DUF2214 family protein [Gammaproteobacteria bacterium]|nr:DUF2214 family protein [Gammaproteobacteria bacterium]
MIAQFATALAALYHVLATAAAMMAVFHFARRQRGEEARQPLWRDCYARAELHLWISGVLLVLIGAWVTGWAKYLDNPKLWTKVSLIVLWGLNSLWMKRTLHSASPARRDLMFGISIAALAYGSFLGVAKPLAYGVLPFGGFLAGFLATIAACTWIARRYLRAGPAALRYPVAGTLGDAHARPQAGP